MPLESWIMVTEEGKDEYLCKDHTNCEGVDLYEVWCKVYDDYIERIGLHDLHIRILKKMQQKALIQLAYVETGERFKLTELQIIELDLKSMMANRGEGMSIREALIPLSKWIGYRINSREITALEFFQMRDRYGKENKQKRHK
jgi:hypothetical protein